MIKEQKGQCSDENTAQKTHEIKCAKFKRASMHIDRTTPISKTTPRLTTPKTTVTTTIATTSSTTVATTSTATFPTPSTTTTPRTTKSMKNQSRIL